MLAYNAQQTTFLAILPVRCCILHTGHSARQVPYPAYWESTALSTLQFMAVVANCFCAIVAMHTLAMITSSEMHVIKVYLPCVYP